MKTPTDNPPPNAGPPKWLIYGFVIKALLIVLVVGGVLWWTSR